MICNKLVELGAFNSKNEARMMINNGGVSIIPCINEDYEVSCFEVECESEDLDAPKSYWEYFVQVGAEMQFYKKGYVLSPDRTHIPAKLWDVRFCNIDLLNFREKLMHDTPHNPFYSLLIKNPNKGFLENETMAVITWDKAFGKNPWLITDLNMQYALKPGDVIKIGKKKTIVV